MGQKKFSACLPFKVSVIYVGMDMDMILFMGASCSANWPLVPLEEATAYRNSSRWVEHKRVIVGDSYTTKQQKKINRTRSETVARVLFHLAGTVALLNTTHELDVSVVADSVVAEANCLQWRACIAVYSCQ